MSDSPMIPARAMTPAEAALVDAVMSRAGQLGPVDKQVADALVALQVEQLGPELCARYVAACEALAQAQAARRDAAEEIRRFMKGNEPAVPDLLNRLVPGSAATATVTPQPSVPLDTPDPEALARLRGRRR